MGVIVMMWGDGWGWGWIAGGLVMLVFWGGLIALVVYVVRGGARSSRVGNEQITHDARNILAERFARGEISEEEFEQRKRVLEQHP
jgi:putative membrane protein